MAIPSTGTLLTSGGTTTSVNLDTINVATFTSTAGHLLIALVANGRGSTASGGGTVTISDNFTGSLGTWTTIDSIFGIGSAGDPANFRITGWWSTVGGVGTGTIHFVASGSGSERRWGWEILSFTGQTATSPIGTVNTYSSTAGPDATATLGALGGTQRAVGWFFSLDAVDILAGTNEVEIAEVAGGTLPTLKAQAEWGTEAAMNWGSLGTRHNLGVIFSIVGSADAGVTWILERIERHYPRGVGRGIGRGVA